MLNLPPVMNIIPRLTHLLRTGLPGLLLSAVALAGGLPLQNTETSDDTLGFNLLPRSLQKNPLVDLTVVTELTEDGRKLPPPSSAQPAYYSIESAGYHAEGHGADDRHLPAPAELATSFLQALAVNGYRPATPAHPPTLLIVYYWGAHTNLDAGSPDTEVSATPDIGHKNLLSRAALVGGTRFAEELRTALHKQDMENEVQRSSAENMARLGLAPEIGSVLIDYGPLRLFTERDAKTRQLYSALGECYYAVVSAYDYAAAARGQRRLLWRSKMTLDSQGVAMRETLPGLILNAGKYFGVDMPEAATMAKRLQQETSIKLGPLEVKEYLEPAAAPPPAKPRD